VVALLRLIVWCGFAFQAQGAFAHMARLSLAPAKTIQKPQQDADYAQDRGLTSV
jgi:hypothetical protein